MVHADQLGKLFKSPRRRQIEDLQSFAHARGGCCLSKTYRGIHAQHIWQCEKGHVWRAEPNSVIHQGTWCPFCSRTRKHTIEEMQRVAIAHGGECLSTEYHDANSKLEWRCASGHIWHTTPSQILNAGSWCPKCADKRNADQQRKYTITDMQSLAKSRNGKCLSTVFESVTKKLEWCCSEGHIWKAIPNSVMRGNWCSVCSAYISERVCRRYFELLFACRFPKVRPSWLRIGVRRILELDGYNSRRKLAFEYHGRQHYQRVLLFNNDLEKSRRYDEIKRDRCHKRGVTLIEIPCKIKRTEQETYIRAECSRAGIPVPRQNAIRDDELQKAFSPAQQELSELQSIARSRGGRLLSFHYDNALSKVTWECNKGHVWDATPSSVKNSDTWCAICAGRATDTIAAMREIALVHGGTCLSDVYINQGTKLWWRCNRGHEWPATPRMMKNRNSWCPYCSGRRLWSPGKSESEARIAELNQLAQRRGGRCLAKEYRNSATNIKWACSKGHEWEATPANIKRGQWCPYCLGRKLWAPGKTQDTVRLIQLKELAISRGGKCLSDKYCGSNGKLLWECAKGHIWQAKPKHIVSSRSWCPQCCLPKGT